VNAYCTATNPEVPQFIPQGAIGEIALLDSACVIVYAVCMFISINLSCHDSTLTEGFVSNGRGCNGRVPSFVGKPFMRCRPDDPVFQFYRSYGCGFKNHSIKN